MGLPMTRYALLSKLMRKDKGQSNGWDAEYEKEAMAIPIRFSLYAFVLCDHEDIPFRGCITDMFEDLDRHTGRNILFTALIKPETKVRHSLERYYKMEEALKAISHYTIDDNLYQHALLEAFQISSTDLPAIVLTTSLESDQWFVIRVADAPQCIQWLEVLRGYADDIAENFPVNIEDVLNKRVSQSTANGDWYAVDGAPICELLSAVEAAAGLVKNRSQLFDDEDLEYTRSIFDEVCDRLINYIDINDSEDDEEKMKKEEKKGIIVSLVRYLQALAFNPDMRCPRTPNRNSSTGLGRMVEPETLRYIKMFKILSNNREMQDMEDHTVLCSLIHKIFESEINASILQLMRKQIRIPMPDFYDKFFPDRKDCYVKNVNLNRYLKGNPKKYVSPGLGNACFAFNALSEEAEFRGLLSGYGISDCDREMLSNLWHCISEIRNREAHCQTITKEQYHEIRSAVTNVMTDYLPTFFEIKKDLKGGAVLP